ncbi:MAG: helix-turn-helix transcriptional regulator [Pseudomonadota bacterium]
MDIHSLSKALKDLRIKRGMSLAKLASLVNTSVSTLSRYESGWERFELYTLNKIATSLGYKLDIDFKENRPVRAPKTISGAIKKLQRLFWDHKLTKNDFTRYPVWITERVIEYGSLEDVQALINVLGKKAFLKQVANSRFQSPKTEAFWKMILEKEGIKCTKRPFPREARIY